MNALTTEATKNGWYEKQFFADILNRTQSHLFEYDQEQVAKLLRYVNNCHFYDVIDKLPIDYEWADPDYVRNIIYHFAFLPVTDTLTDEVLLKYYALLKKFAATEFPNQLQVSSFEYPYYCSISFTNQYRSCIKRKMEKITGIDDLNSLNIRGESGGMTFVLYEWVKLRPVGVGEMFGIDNPMFYFYENENGNCYTYMQSSILTHYLRQPCNTFFWVRCYSRIDKSKKIFLWDDYEDGELNFEILDRNPDFFPKDYASMPYKFRSSFNKYCRHNCDSHLSEYDQRCYLKEAIFNPTLWIDNVIEYKKATERYRNTGNF